MDAPIGLILLILSLIQICCILYYAFFVALSCLSILWAPFASLMCDRNARARGLRVGHYTLAGMSLSGLLIIPWVFLIIRMKGRKVSHTLVASGVAVAYALWGIATLASLLLMIGIAFEVSYTWRVWFLILSTANLAAWIFSIAYLSRNYARVQESCGPGSGVLPHSAWTLTFVFMFVYTHLAYISIFLAENEVYAQLFSILNERPFIVWKIMAALWGLL